MTAPADWTLLTAARLLDGSGAGRLDDAAVLIEGGTIRTIGRRSEVRPPDGAVATSHDYGDATILPGLVDGHTHLVGIGDGTRGDDLAAQGEDLLLIRATVNARAMLHSGVTTIRENGSMGRIAFSVREAIRRGIAEGPSMVVSGRAVTITGGHLHWFGGEADGPEDLRHTVRQLVKEGADFIKIMASGGSTRSSHPYLPAFTPDELRAIVDEAHRHQRLTAAHAVPNVAIEDCLDAGLDMIIHCSMTDDTGAYVYRPDLADRMADAGVWVNPTMHDLRAWLWYYRDEEAAGRRLDATEVASRDELRRLYDDKLDAVRRLHAAGVRLIAGSRLRMGPQPGRRRMAGDRRPHGCRVVDRRGDRGRDDRLGRRDRRGRRGRAASSRADRRISSWSPATRSPTSPCSAILSTSSRPATASSEASEERADEGRSAAAAGLLQRVRGLASRTTRGRGSSRSPGSGERLGFDSLWTGEHVLAKWDPEGPAFDCVTIQTAVAAVVPRVDIGFCVINSTFRNPAMTAKMAGDAGHDQRRSPRPRARRRASRTTRRGRSGIRIRS